jgi:hypothetical protein
MRSVIGMRTAIESENIHPAMPVLTFRTSSTKSIL